MRVKVTLSLLVILAVMLASRGAPVAQQPAAGQPAAGQPAGQPAAGSPAAGDGQDGAGRGGRGRGAGRSEAERDYVPPVRSPLNKATATIRPVTDAMLRNPDPGDWLMFRRTYDGQSY